MCAGLPTIGAENISVPKRLGLVLREKGGLPYQVWRTGSDAVRTQLTAREIELTLAFVSCRKFGIRSRCLRSICRSSGHHFS